jgi:hypothetical protein
MGGGERIEKRHEKGGGMVSRHEAYEAPKIGFWGRFQAEHRDAAVRRVCRCTSQAAAKIRQDYMLCVLVGRGGEGGRLDHWEGEWGMDKWKHRE